MYDPHLHLLIDDTEIEYRHGLTRFIEQPVRLSPDPVLQPREPWEGRGVSLWGSVYLIEGTFHMWYLDDGLFLLHAGGGTRGAGHPCRANPRRYRRRCGDGSGVAPYHTTMSHATSTDGILWTRSRLDLCPLPGSPVNNVVYLEDYQPPLSHAHPFTVLHDPAAPEGERFRFVAYYMEERGRPGRKRGYLVSSSPDGLHWQAARRVLLSRGDRTSVIQDFKRGGFIMASRGDGHGEHH